MLTPVETPKRDNKILVSPRALGRQPKVSSRAKSEKLLERKRSENDPRRQTAPDELGEGRAEQMPDDEGQKSQAPSPATAKEVARLAAELGEARSRARRIARVRAIFSKTRQRLATQPPASGGKHHCLREVVFAVSSSTRQVMMGCRFVEFAFDMQSEANLQNILVEQVALSLHDPDCDLVGDLLAAVKPLQDAISNYQQCSVLDKTKELLEKISATLMRLQQSKDGLLASLEQLEALNITGLHGAMETFADSHPEKAIPSRRLVQPISMDYDYVGEKTTEPSHSSVQRKSRNAFQAACVKSRSVAKFSAIPRAMGQLPKESVADIQASISQAQRQMVQLKAQQTVLLELFGSIVALGEDSENEQEQEQEQEKEQEQKQEQEDDDEEEKKEEDQDDKFSEGSGTQVRNIGSWADRMGHVRSTLKDFALWNPAANLQRRLEERVRMFEDVVEDEVASEFRRTISHPHGHSHPTGYGRQSEGATRFFGSAAHSVRDSLCASRARGESRQSLDHGKLSFGITCRHSCKDTGARLQHVIGEALSPRTPKTPDTPKTSTLQQRLSRKPCRGRALRLTDALISTDDAFILEGTERSGDAARPPGITRGSWYEPSPVPWSMVRLSLATVPEQPRGNSDDEALKKFKADGKMWRGKALGLTDGAFILGCEETTGDAVHSQGMIRGSLYEHAPGTGSMVGPSRSIISERPRANLDDESLRKSRAGGRLSRGKAQRLSNDVSVHDCKAASRDTVHSSPKGTITLGSVAHEHTPALAPGSMARPALMATPSSLSGDFLQAPFTVAAASPAFPGPSQRLLQQSADEHRGTSPPERRRAATAREALDYCAAGFVARPTLLSSADETVEPRPNTAPSGLCSLLNVGATQSTEDQVVFQCDPLLWESKSASWEGFSHSAEIGDRRLERSAQAVSSDSKWDALADLPPVRPSTSPRPASPRTTRALTPHLVTAERCCRPRQTATVGDPLAALQSRPPAQLYVLKEPLSPLSHLVGTGQSSVSKYGGLERRARGHCTKPMGQKVNAWGFEIAVWEWEGTDHHRHHARCTIPDVPKDPSC